jgi:hypothetical protein
MGSLVPNDDIHAWVHTCPKSSLAGTVFFSQVAAPLETDTTRLGQGTGTPAVGWWYGRDPTLAYSQKKKKKVLLMVGFLKYHNPPLLFIVQ